MEIQEASIKFLVFNLAHLLTYTGELNIVNDLAQRSPTRGTHLSGGTSIVARMWLERLESVSTYLAKLNDSFYFKNAFMYYVELSFKN